MRDWKLENLPNGEEIPVIPFRTEKEDYLLGSLQFPNGFSGKLLSIWLSTEISGFLA